MDDDERTLSAQIVRLRRANRTLRDWLYDLDKRVTALEVKAEPGEMVGEVMVTEYGRHDDDTK